MPGRATEMYAICLMISVRDVIPKEYIQQTYLCHRGKVKGQCGHWGGVGRAEIAHEQRAVSRIESKMEDRRL